VLMSSKFFLGADGQIGVAIFQAQMQH